MTGGQGLAQALRQEGIQTLFGLPGVQLDWAFDALHELRDDVALVHTRHEQASAYMADGYARSSGRIGAYIVVPGPGVLNTLAALSTAFACSSPVLCITGQIQSDLIGIGRGLLHEVNDQLGLLRHVTKWAGRATTPGEVPMIVHEACRQLRSGRPQPVAIEIPPDVLQRRADVDLGAPLPAERTAGDPALLEQAAEILGRAERPLILAGGGVLAAEAWEELRAVAETLEAPVLMSSNGRGALSDRHRLATTTLATASLLPTADAVLAVGTRMIQSQAQTIQVGARPLIRIEAEPAQLQRSTQPTHGIVGDAKLALAELANRIGRHNRKRPSRQAELDDLRQRIRRELDAIEPQASYARALRDALPDDAIVVNELTQVGYYARFALPVHEPRTLLGSGYQGTLGSGFPTALGAQVGNPDRLVVSLNGDGGFTYNSQEIATAVQHGIPLKTIVFDDGAYGNVRRTQEQSFAGRTIGSDLRNPSFARLAEVHGMAGVRAEGPDGLRAALREAVGHEGPVLIEAPVGAMPMFLRLQAEIGLRAARAPAAAG
ncbi:MAG TPA: thiamine pyrophosphate-dependent enzyme [Chloroflexota bacterium]|jgi:acetolactate synthase-1/2/3 large subunit